MKRRLSRIALTPSDFLLLLAIGLLVWIVGRIILRRFYRYDDAQMQEGIFSYLFTYTGLPIVLFCWSFVLVCLLAVGMRNVVVASATRLIAWRDKRRNPHLGSTPYERYQRRLKRRRRDARKQQRQTETPPDPEDDPVSCG